MDLDRRRDEVFAAQNLLSRKIFRDTVKLCLSGRLGPGYQDVLQSGMDAMMSISLGPGTLGESLRDAYELIKDGTERACRLIQMGLRMKERQ